MMNISGGRSDAKDKALPKTSTEEFGSTLPSTGFTEYRDGALVLNLNATGVVVEFVSFTVEINVELDFDSICYVC